MCTILAEKPEFVATRFMSGGGFGFRRNGILGGLNCRSIIKTLSDGLHRYPIGLCVRSPFIVMSRNAYQQPLEDIGTYTGSLAVGVGEDENTQQDHGHHAAVQ